MATIEGKKTGGRAKGTPNKTTGVTKARLAEILEVSFCDIPEMLEQLKDKPKDYIDAVAKILPYVLPKAETIIELTTNSKIDVENSSVEDLVKAAEAIKIIRKDESKDERKD